MSGRRGFRGSAAAGKRLRAFAALSLLSLLLAACAGVNEAKLQAPQRGRGHYVVGSPYEVNGVWYYPRVDYHYDKVGVASWYGESYNGRPTADGEIYDVDKLTAAHPTLPLPSIVTVTNLQNGRSLRLRVNDRGPFVDGRIIDVSQHAAHLLGFETAGTAPVRVKIRKRQSIEVADAAMGNSPGNAPGNDTGGRILFAAASLPADKLTRQPAANPPPAPPPESPPPAPVAAPLRANPAPRPTVLARRSPERSPRQQPVARSFASLLAATLLPRAQAATLPAASPLKAASEGRFFVQAGAFADHENARRVRARIARFGEAEVMPASVDGVVYYRVRLGPLSSLETANRMLARVVASGYPAAIVLTR